MFVYLMWVLQVGEILVGGVGVLGFLRGQKNKNHVRNFDDMSDKMKV